MAIRNYESVQEIIDAGTTYMTTLSSTSNDDGTISISNPPSWIKFNGVTPTTMYASGNSWFGVTGNTEQIRFNRRDAKIYYLYAEEGTLYEYYHFYKLRWRGYSAYNKTTSSYSQEWEVIFFSTGDIMIRAVTIPTSSYSGTFNIVAAQTYTYSAPSTSKRYVSFYSQDDNNSTFQISYDIIDIPLPFHKRWLIEDGGVFYNVVDGALNPLEITELTAANLLEYGNDDPPDGSLLLSLVAPTIYHWNDSNSEEFEVPTQPEIKATLAAVPYTQLLEVHVDMSHETITGIGSVSAQYGGDVLAMYSLDDGANYTEPIPMADFLNLDFATIFAGLPEDKVLYLRFSLCAEAFLEHVLFNFTNT